MKFIAAILLLFSVVAFADVKEVSPSPLPYDKEIEKWRGDRLISLKSETGWLTLVGLFWLKPGVNKFGSDPEDEIVLPGDHVPKVAGSFNLDDKGVRLEVAPDAELLSEGKKVTSMQIHSDAEENPTVLNLGTLNLYLIRRVDRFGIRVKDKASPARNQFSGLEYFPIDLKWNVHARFEKYTPAKKIPIVNVLGMIDNIDSPGAIVFEQNGQSYRLDAIPEKGENKLFIIFSDTTSGKETYGAGRYLYTPLPDSKGDLLIDFNKAFNPPCAFTSYATCPLPPPQNKLKLRVDAGEKKYTGKIH